MNLIIYIMKNLKYKNDKFFNFFMNFQYDISVTDIELFKYISLSSIEYGAFHSPFHPSVIDKLSNGGIELMLMELTSLNLSTFSGR